MGARVCIKCGRRGHIARNCNTSDSDSDSSSEEEYDGNKKRNEEEDSVESNDSGDTSEDSEDSDDNMDENDTSSDDTDEKCKNGDGNTDENDTSSDGTDEKCKNDDDNDMDEDDSDDSDEDEADDDRNMDEDNADCDNSEESDTDDDDNNNNNKPRNCCSCRHNKDSDDGARICISKDVDLDHNDVEQSADNHQLLTTTQGAAAEQIPDIHICMGDLTNQNVDVIVVCSSSSEFTESVLQAAGHDIRKIYEQRRVSTTASEAFAVKCSSLACKEILFVPWTPSQRVVLKEQTIWSFMTEAIKYVIGQNYRSVAFPPVGCDQFGLNIDGVARAMINHIKLGKYPLDFTIVIHPKSSNIFDTFQRVNGTSLIMNVLPNTLAYASNSDTLRFLITTNSPEYDTIVAEFNQTMHGKYRRINGIERIQNERWHKQYLVHRDDFYKRLNMNTEKFLYHGCTHVAADSIIKEYFNRSFAGKNGTVYGNGVYFSSRAGYSHDYATPNARGERCMFFARVLVGYSTIGNTTMKVCPPNYHTTTDGDHIFVTYHDTQAYGQYLIHYQ